MGVRHGREVNAMRVNIEDDLFLSGRLTAFARALGVEEDTALGRLAFAWRETQHRELVTVSRESFRLATFVRLRDPQGTLLAMEASGLATKKSDDEWLIHGNEEHAKRLGMYREKAQKGGIARQRASKLPASNPKKPAASQQAASKLNQRALLAPSSLLQKQDPDLCVSDSDLPPAINFEDLPRSPPATPAGRHPSVWSELAGEVERAKPLTPAAQIRRAYHEAYGKKFKREFKGWGKRENGQAAQLVGSWSLATVLELIPKFFDWNNPQVMMAGYPFGLGHASFISRIHELDADTHAPDRKRLANAVNANDRQVGNEDAEKIRYETEMRELRKGWAEPKQIAGQS